MVLNLDTCTDMSTKFQFVILRVYTDKVSYNSNELSFHPIIVCNQTKTIQQPKPNQRRLIVDFHNPALLVAPYAHTVSRKQQQPAQTERTHTGKQTTTFDILTSSYLSNSSHVQLQNRISSDANPEDAYGNMWARESLTNVVLVWERCY